MLNLSKTNITRKSVIHRPVRVCNSILSPTVIAEYLSHKHIDLADGLNVISVVDSMTHDQYKLLAALGQDVMLYELKNGFFIVIAMIVLFCSLGKT